MESVKNLSLHSRVYIELNKDEDCYTGTLTQYHSKFKCIELTELTGIKSKKKFDGAHRFYEQEIEKITALDARPSVSVESTKSSIASDQKESSHNDIISLQSERIKSRYVDSAFPLDLDTDNKSNESEFKSVEDGSNHYDFLMESNTTTIGDAEQEQINEKICSAVHIIQCDASYHAALNDLRRQEIVGFNVEGSRLGRLQEGSLLSFSTNEKIYLFDLMMLGRIFPEIKRILEAEKPRKVVHNSCLIVDHLKHRYKCQLNGIHDTLITHFHIKKKKEVITIGDCLSEYFNLPIKSSTKENWVMRPLSERRKSIAATNVAYLIKLFFHMNVDISLRPLKRMTNEYAQSYSHTDDIVEIFDQITNRRNPGLDLIGTDDNNLCALTLQDLSEVE